MRISFSRGQIVKAAGSMDSAAFAFSWEQDRPFVKTRGVDGRFVLERVTNRHYVLHGTELGSIHLTRKAWWEDLPELPADSGLWLSYQGFVDGIWHDGAFGRFVNGSWTDLVLSGAAFILELGRSELAIDDLEEFYSDFKFLSQKGSLIVAMLKQFSIRAGETCEMIQTGGDADFLLQLLLMRLAFPTIELSLSPKNVAWKRLAQNLNIQILREGNGQRSGRRLPCLPSLGPREKVIDFLRWQQAQSPFIPQKLFLDLSS